MKKYIVLIILIIGLSVLFCGCTKKEAEKDAAYYDKSE